MPEPKSLTELLKPQMADPLFIQMLRSPSAKENLLSASSDDLASKVASLCRVTNKDQALEQFCKDPAFDSLWESAYFQIASGLEELKEAEGLTVYKQASIPCFDLLRGLYFYYHAQQMRLAQPEREAAEVTLLQQAMKYNSIQAMQRYHALRYLEVSKNTTNTADIFDEIIANCQSMLPSYGSFAYLMLTEAHNRYADYLVGINQIAEARVHFRSAKSACDHAEGLLESSQYSIHNASLGRGLMTSNTLQLNTIKEIKNYLRDKLFSKIVNAHIALSLLSKGKAAVNDGAEPPYKNLIASYHHQP
jgi:hypothetical protein